MVRFEDLADGSKSAFSKPYGSAIMKEDYVPVGVPVVRGVNLRKGIFHDDDFVFISDVKADQMPGANLTSGDLVFTHRGTIGQVSMIPRNRKHARYVLSTSQVKARLDPNRAIPEFYYYYFSSQRGQNEILKNISIVGVPGLVQPVATIKSLSVLHPPLAIQRAIATILGALDDKISVNNRIAEKSLGLAQARYDEAAQAGTYTRLMLMSDCAQWLSGGTPDTSEESYWGGDIPWISALSLKSPWIDDSDRKVTPLGVANGTRLVARDVVIFVVRGSSLDTEFRIGLTQRQVAFGQDCKALIAKPGIDPTTLFIAIKSRTDEILGLVDHTGHGAGRLATDLLSKVQVILPGEQQTAAVAGWIRPIVEVGAARRAENRRLRELRNWLLPKLMSGEIRMRDAEKAAEDVT